MRVARHRRVFLFTPCTFPFQLLPLPPVPLNIFQRYLSLHTHALADLKAADGGVLYTGNGVSSVAGQYMRFYNHLVKWGSVDGGVT